MIVNSVRQNNYNLKNCSDHGIIRKRIHKRYNFRDLPRVNYGNKRLYVKTNKFQSNLKKMHLRFQKTNSFQF